MKKEITAYRTNLLPTPHSKNDNENQTTPLIGSTPQQYFQTSNEKQIISNSKKKLSSAGEWRLCIDQSGP